VPTEVGIVEYNALSVSWGM